MDIHPWTRYEIARLRDEERLRLSTRCGASRRPQAGDPRRRSRRSRRVVARLAAEARARRGSGLGQGVRA